MPVEYMPIEMIFHLLCICRRQANQSPQTTRAAMRKRGLRSLGDPAENPARETLPSLTRIDFLVRLCQAASLLDDSSRPYPTLLVDEWLGWPYHEQIDHLLKAWIQAPAYEKTRRLRADLLQQLQQGLPTHSTQRRELTGLQFLGICVGEQLTELGAYLLGQFRTPYSWERIVSTAPWERSGGQLVVPFPPDWKLLWALEAFFDPHEAGIYGLDEKNLRLAAQRGALQASPSLPEIIERGTGEPMPADLLHLLAGAPTIRLVRGFVLEFSHADEIKKLRKSPAWRRALEHLLSARHVALDPWQGYVLLRRLQKQGLLSEQELANTSPPDYAVFPTNPSFSKAERVYLLSLALTSEALQNAAAPPPGLLSKLAAGLDHPLRAAAARKASAALERIRPAVDWRPEESTPPLPSEDLISILQMAIQRGESIDVLYQATSRHVPELRHLTPLLVEARGERYYLIAYCHTRRANRTFRLDRMKLYTD